MATPVPPPGTIPPGSVLTIGPNAITVERFLAEGGFAHVYVARLPSGEQCVLKRLVCMDADTFATFKQEVMITRRVSGHKNLVTYLDSAVGPYRTSGMEGHEIFILMEFCTGGHLVGYLNDRLGCRPSERDILHIFSEICEAVAHMHYHAPPLLHRDVKVENILIAGDGTFKLCDFGSATPKLVPASMSLSAKEILGLEEEINKVTTIAYRAPELIDLYQRKGMTEKVDIWALGILLYKLCYYTTPFEDAGSLAILNAKYSIPRHPPYSGPLIHLIQTLLNPDPLRRPNIYGALALVSQLRNVPCPIANIYADHVGTPASPTPPPKPLPSVPPDTTSADPLAKDTHFGKADGLGSSPPRPSRLDPNPPAPIANTNSTDPPMRRGRPQKNSSGAGSASSLVAFGDFADPVPAQNLPGVLEGFDGLASGARPSVVPPSASFGSPSDLFGIAGTASGAAALFDPFASLAAGTGSLPAASTPSSARPSAILDAFSVAPVSYPTPMSSAAFPLKVGGLGSTGAAHPLPMSPAGFALGAAGLPTHTLPMSPAAFALGPAGFASASANPLTATSGRGLGPGSGLPGWAPHHQKSLSSSSASSSGGHARLSPSPSLNFASPPTGSGFGMGGGPSQTGAPWVGPPPPGAGVGPNNAPFGSTGEAWGAFRSNKGGG